MTLLPPTNGGNQVRDTIRYTNNNHTPMCTRGGLRRRRRVHSRDSRMACHDVENIRWERDFAVYLPHHHKWKLIGQRGGQETYARTSSMDEIRHRLVPHCWNAGYSLFLSWYRIDNVHSLIDFGEFPEKNSQEKFQMWNIEFNTINIIL